MTDHTRYNIEETDDGFRICRGDHHRSEDCEWEEFIPATTVIYVAIWKDRHADTEAYTFSDKTAAIEWANKKVHETARDPEDIDEELTQPMIDSKWVYYGCYSCEGDCIYVIETSIDKELY